VHRLPVACSNYWVRFKKLKYIAVFLVLVNLGYLAWLNFGATPVAPVAFSEPKPLLSDGMILLSEYQSRVLEEGLILASQNRMCLLVTGFSDFDDAISFEVAASNRGLSTSQQLLGNPLASQFRVYLPPASSRAIADITLDTLSEQAADADLSIEIYLITRGLLENSIALGVLPSLAEAEGIKAALINLGYSPVIQELPLSDQGIGIQLGSESSLSLESSDWLSLIEQRSYLNALENLCETIAQGTQFP
jgi:hypothetical protein|tara:strand:- start:105 stop:851 length:747 start_codon:yes stop_codon:yes gene_type:complete